MAYGMAERRESDPPTVFASAAHGFPQAVAVAGGRTVYVSGTGGVGRRGRLIGGGDLGAQARQAFGNVVRVVEAAGGGRASNVSVRILLTHAHAPTLPSDAPGPGFRHRPREPAAVQPSALAQRATRTAVDGYKVVKAYPHDPNAYTQGLIFRDGFLYESTGRTGHSSLRKVELETGEVLQKLPIPPGTSPKGSPSGSGQLLQLTWQNNVGLRLRPGHLQAPAGPSTTRARDGGWPTDGHRLILSDGSAQLRFLDPEHVRRGAQVTVKDGGTTVDQLNELEVVNGEVWANVWHTNRIARIDPRPAGSNGWVDLSGLMAAALRLDAEAVLNGIAYDAASRRLFVTGKLWPKLFEIAIVPAKGKSGGKTS